ncbi:hypothetical protein V6N13_030068 [Hibiscus sabdariffa]
MDYSLLLGVHYRAPQHLRPLISYNQVDGLGSVAEEEEDEIPSYPQGLVLVPRDEEVDLLLPGTARLQIQLGVNMPARAEQIPGKEEKMFHEAYDVVLYLGMIDILQDYNMNVSDSIALSSSFTVTDMSIDMEEMNGVFNVQNFLAFSFKISFYC